MRGKSKVENRNVETRKTEDQNAESRLLTKARGKPAAGVAVSRAGAVRLYGPYRPPV
jgi:hypothetical protein